MIKPVSHRLYDLVGSDFYVITGKKIVTPNVPLNHSMVELDSKTVEGIIWVELYSRACLELSNDGYAYLNASIEDAARSSNGRYYLIGKNLPFDLEEVFPDHNGDCSVLVYPRAVRGVCQKEIDLRLTESFKKDSRLYHGDGKKLFELLVGQE